jgi:hypothetical protein
VSLWFSAPVRAKQDGFGTASPAIRSPQAAYSVAPETLKKEFTQQITLRAIRLPLNQVIETLARETKTTLEVDTPLRAEKVLLIVRERTAAEVMLRLGEVYAAEWVTVGKPEDRRYRLQHTAEARRWLTSGRSSAGRRTSSHTTSRRSATANCWMTLLGAWTTLM